MLATVYLQMSRCVLIRHLSVRRARCAACRAPGGGRARRQQTERRHPERRQRRQTGRPGHHLHRHRRRLQTGEQRRDSTTSDVTVPAQLPSVVARLSSVTADGADLYFFTVYAIIYVQLLQNKRLYVSSECPHPVDAPVVADGLLVQADRLIKRVWAFTADIYSLTGVTLILEATVPGRVSVTVTCAVLSGGSRAGPGGRRV